MLSVEPDCWNCDQPASCLAGLYPDQPSPTHCGLFTCESEPATELARVLADRHGHQDLTRRLKRYFSDYRQDWLWADSCRHCGAVLADEWLEREVCAALSCGGVEALRVLAVGECPSEAWQRLVYAGGGAFAVRPS